MEEERPFCPECGDPLSMTVVKDDETGEYTIEFFCEGAGEDRFHFQILTGLTNEDIANLEEEGKIIRKEMGMKLLQREPDSYSEI